MNYISSHRCKVEDPSPGCHTLKHGVFDKLYPVSFRPFTSEIDVTSTTIQANHPTFLQCYGWTKIDDHKYWVCDKVDHDMSRFFTSKNFDIQSRFYALYEVAVALNHLHSLKLTYFSINSKNIYISNGKVKLADVGLSKSRLDIIASNLLYLDPEFLTRPNWEQTCDVFAFGILIAECLTEETPYTGYQFQTEFQFMKDLEHGLLPTLDLPKYILELKQDVPLRVSSEKMMAIAHSCWQKGNLRPTMETIVNDIETSVIRLGTPQKRKRVLFEDKEEDKRDQVQVEPKKDKKKKKPLEKKNEEEPIVEDLKNFEEKEAKNDKKSRQKITKDEKEVKFVPEPETNVVQPPKDKIAIEEAPIFAPSTPIKLISRKSKKNEEANVEKHVPIPQGEAKEIEKESEDKNVKSDTTEINNSHSIVNTPQRDGNILDFFKKVNNQPNPVIIIDAEPEKKILPESTPTIPQQKDTVKKSFHDDYKDFEFYEWIPQHVLKSYKNGSEAEKRNLIHKLWVLGAQSMGLEQLSDISPDHEINLKKSQPIHQGILHFIKKEYKKSLELLKEYPENHLCQFFMGLIYSRDTEVMDLSDSFSCIATSAHLGNSSAQALLGSYFENGIGAEKDVKEAFSWYTKSSEQGNSQGWYYLASCYEVGTGCVENQELSKKYYNLALKGKENPNALFRVGLQLLHGSNPSQGLKAIQIAHRQGLEKATWKLIQHHKDIAIKEANPEMIKSTIEYIKHYREKFAETPLGKERHKFLENSLIECEYILNHGVKKTK